MLTEHTKLLRVFVLFTLLIVFIGPMTGSVASAEPDVPVNAAPMQPRIYLPSVRQPPQPAIYLGAYIQSIGWDVYPGQLRDFETATGKNHGIYHYYADWPTFDWNWNRTQMDMIVSSGATPMVTWMSIPGSLGCGDDAWNLDSIINGDHDGYIRGFAQGLAGYNHTVFIRWGHEMNLVEYSWAGYCNGANAAAATKFISAYRHIVDIFRQAGASNAKFIWSPNYESWPGDSWNAINNYYPGDAYVDWIGVVGYNWGASSLNSNYRWMSFTQLFGGFLSSMAATHPGKPVMVADYASVENDGGDKGTWIREAFAAMVNYPNLRAVVWHNLNVTDCTINPCRTAAFPIESSTNSLNAYRGSIAPSTFSADKPYP